MARQKKHSIFTPGTTSQEIAKEILEDYPAPEMTRRLVALSKNLEHEGDALVEDAYDVNELEHMIRGGSQQRAAQDILRIGAMIATIAAGLPLERDELDGSNAHLQLFDSLHPKVNPPIIKCLQQIGGWYLEKQLDYADDLSTALAQGITTANKQDIERIRSRTVYLDETAGLLVKIGRLADAVQQEMAAKTKNEESRGRSAG